MLLFLIKNSIATLPTLTLVLPQTNLPKKHPKFRRPVTQRADMHTQVVIAWCRSYREGVPANMGEL